MKAEGFSASDSETLGVHLKVPRPNIRTMKKNNVGNATGLYYDIIDAWLQQREPSLEELAEALERTDYINIARKIRGKIEIIMDWCGTSYRPHPPQKINNSQRDNSSVTIYSNIIKKEVKCELTLIGCKFGLESLDWRVVESSNKNHSAHKNLLYL